MGEMERRGKRKGKGGRKEWEKLKKINKGDK